MGKFWCASVLFLIQTSFIFCQIEGSECELEEADGAAGEWKLIYKCEYADRLVNVEFKQPTIVFENTTHTYVCCPKSPYQTGILGRTFYDSKNGRLKFGNIDCRYTGQFPLVCCKRQESSETARLYNRLGDDCDHNANTKTADACKTCYNYQKPRGSNTVCPQESAIRIASGEPAEIEQFPHMVALGCRNVKKVSPTDSDIEWIGSGTLITETYVLTAAHVLSSPDYGKIEYALLGTSIKTDIKKGILRYLVQWHRHKLYSYSSHYHDIALVEMDYRIPISKFIQPACLPVEGIVPDVIPTRMTVAGWGRTGQHMNASEKLLQGDMHIQAPQDCRKSLQSKFFKWNSSLFICAKSDTADTCYGDSGGPLMGALQENSMLCGYYVYGIVSFGTVCDRNKSGGYTKVANENYLEWISSIVWPQDK